MFLVLKSLLPEEHPNFARPPSRAQLEAGNYRKERLTFQGLPITIENPRGSMRSGVDPGGRPWSVGMQHDYGYVRGTLGVDGDHFDVFVGPNLRAPMVFVITTRKPPGFVQADEQKAMLGFSSEEEALEAFRMHYDDPRFFGSCQAVPIEQFKAEVRTTRDRPRLLVLRGPR